MLTVPGFSRSRFELSAMGAKGWFERYPDGRVSYEIGGVLGATVVFYRPAYERERTPEEQERDLAAGREDD